MLCNKRSLIISLYQATLLLWKEEETTSKADISTLWSHSNRLVLVFQPKEGILNFHPDFSESHTESSRKRLPNTCSTWIFFLLNMSWSNRELVDVTEVWKRELFIKMAVMPKLLIFLKPLELKLEIGAQITSWLWFVVYRVKIPKTV